MFAYVLTTFFVINYKYYSPHIKAIYEEYHKLKVSDLPNDDWIIYSKEKKYSTYVVIIGESMRKDFMSLYGFNENTTPFIDSLPKKYISNYIGTAVNTTLSVPRVLAKSNGEEVVEQNNIITLANKAGFNTYWISSQGFSGRFNISSSRIASMANNKFFSSSRDDMSLLPKISQTLGTDGDKVVFIHINGSHEYPCNRLHGYPMRYSNYNKTLNCYLSTYNKTDDFIKEIYSYLDEDFSLVYFSDHGLNMLQENNDVKVFRNDKFKQSYQIPFFVSSSDDKVSEVIDVTRSAYNFVDFFADWLGLQTNLTVKDYDIFSDHNDDPPVMSYDKKIESYFNKEDSLTAQDLIN